MDTAKSRYDFLTSDRSNFLDMAREAADLTLPYLIRGEEDYQKGARTLKTPWQSVGSKGVVTLAAKLMLALLPPNTSFFKLHSSFILFLFYISCFTLADIKEYFFREIYKFHEFVF